MRIQAITFAAVGSALITSGCGGSIGRSEFEVTERGVDGGYAVSVELSGFGRTLTPSAHVLEDSAFTSMSDGDLRYRGPYRVFYADDSTDGEVMERRGALSLDFYAADQTLRGSTLEFEVAGRVNGDRLVGEVAFREMTASLQGRIGGNQAIGVFATESGRTDIFAGGFIAAAQ